MIESNFKLTFLQAKSENTSCLRALARTSEAYWGYNQGFLDTFDQVFNITEEFIYRNPVYVAWKDGSIVAFWGMDTITNPEMIELEYFYVAREHLKSGIGKQMWEHMNDWCHKRKIKKINFVTSAQAIGFYERMGAVQTEMSKSMIDGRPIPHFIYETKESYISRDNLNKLREEKERKN